MPIQENIRIGNFESCRTLKTLEEIPAVLKDFKKTVNNVQAVVAITFPKAADFRNACVILATNRPKDKDFFKAQALFKPQKVEFWTCLEDFGNKRTLVHANTGNLNTQFDSLLPFGFFDQRQRELIQNCLKALEDDK